MPEARFVACNATCRHTGPAARRERVIVADHYEEQVLEGDPFLDYAG